jgi:Dam-replacing HTH domain/PLD-like domain
MIVLSPSDAWLKEAVADCTKSFSVSSPYIGSYLATLAKRLDNRVQLTVLTRTVLSEFAARSSDLDAVIKLAERAGGVLSLSSLHAKTYIIDDRRALITSANATHSGMHRNWECGYQLVDRSNVRALRRMLLHGFGSTPPPQLWTVNDLYELQEPVENLRAALPRPAVRLSADIGTPRRVQLPRKEYSRLIGSFSGWLQLTLEGISRIRTKTFSMDEVFVACLPAAREQYPDNRHVREKLRQQMQRHRDLGLVLFVGRGRYELLASPS